MKCGKISRFFWLVGFFCTLIWGQDSQAQTIRLNLGGAKFNALTVYQLAVSITVDAITPTVAIGTAADQLFRDDSTSAAYFGYYLSVGARTTGQAGGTLGHIQIQRGPAETSGRSYYLLGNGTTVPTAQSNLTIAPAASTVIATFARNTTACGASYAANGISGVNGVTCTPARVVAGMDVTQFVKVLWTDPPSSTIVSALSIIFVQF